MSMSDPLADMLTRIRNGVMAKFDTVDIPKSNVKIGVAKVLKEEGYIADYSLKEDSRQGLITVKLKYTDEGVPVITGIKRVSKPGLRKYAKAADIKTVLNGLGISIVSTSKGIVSDRQARAQNTGGEIICEVW